MKYYAAAAFIACLATPVLAEGDIEKGEQTFKKCKSCHQIVSDSGEVIAKGGSTGPNLYGLAGRKAGSVEDFRYGDDLVAAGEAGLVWNEEQFDKYVQNPRDFLRDYLDDSKAKSNMSFRLKKGGEDVYAYLAQFGAAEPAAETEEAPASE